MKKEPKVGIVILNWNTYSETAECLESIEKSIYDNIVVVVVDNGSSGNSIEKISNEFHWCHFIYNDENKGFAGGSNVGIEYAVNEGAEYVLLLNNDIIVTPGFLEPLVRTAEENNKVAAVGGHIYNQSGQETWYLGGKIRPYLADAFKDPNSSKKEEFETEFVTCAYALLSKDFLSNHRLDENYFFGVEEIDLSWRALENGWNLYVNPKSEVFHDDAASTDHMFEGDQLFSSFQKYHNTRGRIYFCVKNNNKIQSIIYYVSIFTFFPIYYIWVGIKYDRFDILFSHLLAIKDHIFKNDPKKPEFFD